MYNYIFNMNESERDNILSKFFSRSYSGGIRSFSNVDVDTVKKLFELNFIDPNESQNSSPTTKEIFDFMVDWPECTVHGYAVSKDRRDYRVSFEGIECDDPELLSDADFMRDFTNLFRNADSFDLTKTRAYCWFD